MEFRVLGNNVDIRDALGEPITVSRPRIRQLLGVLLVEQGRSIPVTTLSERLWDPTDETNTAAALKQAVYLTRQILPDDRLVHDGTGYGLRVEKTDYLDLREFSELVAGAERASGPDPEAAVTIYREALDLWGEPPLQDLPATIATQPIVQSLINERGLVRQALAKLLFGQGNHREVIELGRSWVRQEPLNEELRGSLMLGLHRAGHKGAALFLYKEAAALLGPAQPGPALQQLAAKITRNDPSLDHHPLPARIPPPSTLEDFDPQRPAPPRICNYFVDGKDNFAADRETAAKITQIVPDAAAAAHASKEFLTRAVRYLAAKVGIRQFIDIGSGLPTQHNTHEIAQDLAPDTRVIYVDNDPMVLIFARALLESNPGVAVVQGDLRHPGDIMASIRRQKFLDLTQPVGLLVSTVMQFIPETAKPVEILANLVRFLSTGSHAVISHGFGGDLDPEKIAHIEAIFREAGMPIYLRGPKQVRQILSGSGLEILEPGVARIADWDRPGSPRPLANPGQSLVIGAIARKP